MTPYIYIPSVTKSDAFYYMRFYLHFHTHIYIYIYVYTHIYIYSYKYICSTAWDRMYILTPYTYTREGVRIFHIIFYCMRLSYVHSHTLHIYTKKCETISYYVLYGIVYTFSHPIHTLNRVWDNLILYSTVWDRIYNLTPYTYSLEGVRHSHMIFYGMGS